MPSIDQAGYDPIFTIGSSDRPNTMLLGIKDYEQRSNSGRCSGNHPMEIGRLNPVRGTTEIARDPKASQRKQSWIAGSIEDQINRPAKIPAYYGNSPPYTTLKKRCYI